MKKIYIDPITPYLAIVMIAVSAWLVGYGMGTQTLAVSVFGFLVLLLSAFVLIGFLNPYRYASKATHRR